MLSNPGFIPFLAITCHFNCIQYFVIPVNSPQVSPYSRSPSLLQTVDPRAKLPQKMMPAHISCDSTDKSLYFHHTLILGAFDCL